MKIYTGHADTAFIKYKPDSYHPLKINRAYALEHVPCLLFYRFYGYPFILQEYPIVEIENDIGFVATGTSVLFWNIVKLRRFVRENDAQLILFDLPFHKYGVVLK